MVLPEEEGPLRARMMGRGVVVWWGGGAGSRVWDVEEGKEEGRVILEGEGRVI